MALVNSILALLLTGLYLGLVVLLSLHPATRDPVVTPVLATVITAIAVVPIRARVVAQVNRLLRREWQSAQRLLRLIGAALSRTITPDALRALLVDDLSQRLRLQGATLWMLEPPDDHAFVALGQTHASPGAFLLSNGASIRQISYTDQYLLVPPSSDIDWTRPFVAQKVGLAIPLRVGDRLIGIYGCGLPQKGLPYQKHVVDVLITLAPAIASALENARAYSTIDRLNTQLRTLDQLKDAFIESVGHELRTPLTSLSLVMQLLARQPDMAATLAQVTRTSVLQLQELVNRVLTFDEHLRQQDDEPSPASALIELAPLLHEIADGYATAAAVKGLCITSHIPAGLAVWGHSVRLRRALHEVVDNAVRYSESGEVTLSAKLDDGLAVISISDTGPGIPQEERDQLFVAFYRGSSARALAEHPGTGLGLSIARRDVEALGGRIWLEHSSPEGSTICVAMPAMMVADRQQEPAQEELARRGPTELHPPHAVDPDYEADDDVQERAVGA